MLDGMVEYNSPTQKLVRKIRYEITRRIVRQFKCTQQQAEVIVDHALTESVAWYVNTQ